MSSPSWEYDRQVLDSLNPCSPEWTAVQGQQTAVERSVHRASVGPETNGEALRRIAGLLWARPGAVSRSVALVLPGNQPPDPCFLHAGVFSSSCLPPTPDTDRLPGRGWQTNRCFLPGKTSEDERVHRGRETQLALSRGLTVRACECPAHLGIACPARRYEDCGFRSLTRRPPFGGFGLGLVVIHQ